MTIRAEAVGAMVRLVEHEGVDASGNNGGRSYLCTLEIAEAKRLGIEIVDALVKAEAKQRETLTAAIAQLEADIAAKRASLDTAVRVLARLSREKAEAMP